MWYYTIACVLLILVEACKENEKSKKPFVYFKNYQRTFNDLNDRHLSSAKRLGITPLKSSEDLSKAGWNLKEIKSCKLFQVDKLTHSEPYLVPEACDLLADIARNFKDSLYQKGLPSHSIIVTSVLRTGFSVKKLRKSNGNASANSAHVYGTTFDVAYTRFKKDGRKRNVTFVTSLSKVVFILQRDNIIVRLFILYSVSRYSLFFYFCGDKEKRV